MSVFERCLYSRDVCVGDTVKRYILSHQALAMKTLGVQGKIYVPDCASQAKQEAIKKYGGVLEIYGDDCVKAEAQAKQIAKETKNTTYVSPYNDIEVVHGQSTIG